MVVCYIHGCLVTEGPRESLKGGAIAARFKVQDVPRISFHPMSKKKEAQGNHKKVHYPVNHGK